MDAFIGIDLACAKNKHCPISICTLESGRLIPLLLTKESFEVPRGSGNIATLNREHNYVYANEIKHYILSVCKAHNLTPKRIALDAPLSPKKHSLKRRLAEQALDRLRISCYATPSAADFENIIAKGKAHIAEGKEPSRLPHSMQIFMLAGFALAEVLKEVAEVIEIYPQANAQVLNVAGKHKTKQDQSTVQLKAISEYTGWPNTAHEWESVSDICKAPMHDKIDAYGAAWIASLPVDKRLALGSVEHNDAIWVPDLTKLEKIQKVDIDFSSIKHNVKLINATKPKTKKRMPSESKMPKVCPACNKFEFKMWPFGWDAHAAHKCTGIIGSNPEERKRVFKQKYMNEESMTDYPPSTKYYNEHVAEISQQYLSVSFDEVHTPWSKFLPALLNKPNVSVLDVGAGSGRDIAHLYSQAVACLADENKLGHFVAIEPSQNLRRVGEKHTQHQNIKWLSDSLPSLTKTHSLEISFDLILLSAVWMHIPVSQRARALRKLTNLLKPGGIVVVSLKQGMTEQEQQKRAMYDVSVNELEKLALDLGLVCEVMPQVTSDALNRDGVYWETLVLKLPDDGTGAFPLIRHVALNDGKAATHKLGLLRVLLRIADGHAGAVLRREKTISGERVILPLGLVALYWIHQYKDLIDEHGLFQTPASSPNMGFMKQDGWHSLKKYQSSDFRVGNLFVGDDAVALHRTITQCARNIRDMPCKYITLPNSTSQVFEANSHTVRAKQSLFLDLQSLTQWGEFSLPESTWLAMTRYACWIEPVLVSEWAKTMESYKGNQHYLKSQQQPTMLAALNWEAPKRSTSHVRDRFNKLAGSHLMSCVWSAKPIKRKYDIDHGMPFSRWPNNDLWNLLPSDVKVNNEKRDKLPSAQTLKQSKSRMQEWWLMAWLDDSGTEEKQRFFAEANLALPGLMYNNESIDDVFEALDLQRGRLRDLQQLNEW